MTDEGFDDAGSYMRRKRLLVGWSQRDLANEAGLNIESISKWERGLVRPSPSSLRRLATAYDRRRVEFNVDEVT